MKHFFTNKWRMWGPRSLRAYLRTIVHIRLTQAQEDCGQDSRTPCLLDTDWPLAGKVIVPGACLVPRLPMYRAGGATS